MIPILYDKTGNVKLGELTNCIECLVEEERNGLFEVSLIYPSNDTLFNLLEEENIIVCNANDTLLNQKFRIYMTRKLMSNRIEVFARHISFDLAYDYIDSIDIENQSCEYTLNTIFRNSQFSTHYKGYSDIINAQNYKISKVNCIEAIGGTSGSILDTFGTGAEILRDNTNIHVLNKRGHDNGMSIEYAKNLTGFELEEDYSELITRIIPFATYSNSETNEDVLVEANAVDSDYISNYSHPYISYMDFSDKFGDEEVPTTEKLTRLAEKYFENNNCDKPKQNFKIEFIPLSKCVGYEDIQDNISLCDTVTIKDTRYNIDTKAKVIKTVFDVLKNKYESMELGEPRTTLGDIINSSSGGQDGEQGPPGPQGPPGADGNIGDFPNSLPPTPVLSSNVYGFASIELNWTYENKVYYNYELYGSKIKDFIPNEFDLIHAGQTSSYLFQAKPNETWYFRVCAVNTHGERTPFSSQVTVNTTKIDDLSNYVQNQAIDEALIGALSLDRGWVGTLKGNYIDAKQLSVTNGNGERTLDIDSFGNVNLNVNSLQISSSNVATENYANNQANNSLNSAKTYANNVANTAQTNAINTAKDYTNTKITDVKAEIKVTTDSISQRVSSTESTTSTLSSKVTVVESTANTAKSTADKAQTTANSANTLANTANNTANTNKNNIATLQSTVTTTNNKVAELTTSLDSITQRVQSTESSIQNTNNMLSEVSTGVNKVLFEIYGKTGQDGTEIVTIDDYLDATLLHTLLLDDFQMFGGMDYYLGKMTTHLYFNENVTHTVQAFADDGSSLYLNGTLVASMPTCSETQVTLNFKAGWNKIVWVYNEGNGGDGCRFTPSIKTLPGLVYMNAYPVSGDIEGLQAISSTVKTTNNRVAEIVTNLDSITQRVSSNESTIQTTNNKIDNLQVGGRNLIKFSDSYIHEGDVIYFRNVQLEPNTIYTITDYEGAFAGGDITVRNNDCSEVLFNIATWGHQGNKHTFTLPSHIEKGNYVLYLWKANGGTAFISTGKKYQLEKGNISTDFSIAPEDVQNEIDYTKTELTTTNNRVAEIVTSLDGITQRVASTENTLTTTNAKLDGLQVGGRNYIPTSGNFTNSVGDWVSNGSTISIDSSVTYFEYNTLKIGNNSHEGINYNGWIKLKPNTTYTYSITAKADKVVQGSPGMPLHMWLNTYMDIAHLEIIEDNSHNNISTSWGRTYVVFKTPNNAEFYYWKPFIYGKGDATVWVANFQCEEGNKPSDWTPPIEEVQSQIDNVDSKVQTTNNKVASIEANLNSITSRVSSTESSVSTINGNVSNLQNRVNTAEQKITDSAIVSTVTNSQTYKNGLNGKVSTNQVISSINQTAEAIKISANKLDLTGELDLQGRFKCWKSNTDKTGNYLHMNGAMMFGYNKTGGSNPVFASGLWTDENMGYFSVGYTRADVTDANGCLWMSPQHGNAGCRLTYSKLVGTDIVSTNLYFQKDGALLFSTNINGLNSTDDRYTYQFDSGVSTRALRCDNLRTYHIYPRNTGSSNIGSPSMRYKDIFVDSLSTTNNQLRLGTVKSDGSWQTYGALDINSSTGYIFPHKGNGQLSLGTNGNRFHGISLVNSPSVSSDERLKTDIHYLNEPMSEEPTILDGRVERNMKITTKDMYDFVKDDLKLASYRYNLNLERGNTSTDYGFIAQDILFTRVGSEIVQLEDKEDLNSELSYNQGNYIATLAGALQETIKKIEVLENKIKELESK